RHVIASHYSEWSDFPDWQTALRSAPELVKKGKAGEREANQLYNDQILPGLWLMGDVPQKIGLAANAPLYFYHPVSFLNFMNEHMETKDTGGLKKATAEDRKTATGKAMSDFDDKDGTSFIAKADLEKPSDVHNLELPDMVDGYGD